MTFTMRSGCPVLYSVQCTSCHVGQRFHVASWLSFPLQAGPRTFFRLIAVDDIAGEDDDEPIWSFFSLFGENDKVDAMLLRCQMALVHDWLESIKSMETVDSILDEGFQVDLLQFHAALRHRLTQ